jgi:hypothetical protein
MQFMDGLPDLDHRVSRTAFVIEDFAPQASNTPRGFARVCLPSGMILHDVAIHQRNDAAWASSASKPMVDGSGTVIRDQKGKTKYALIIEFASRELRDRFSTAAIQALRWPYAEALA